MFNYLEINKRLTTYPNFTHAEKTYVHKMKCLIE